MPYLTRTRNTDTFMCHWIWYIPICPTSYCGIITLQWHHNGRDSVWNHQPHDCFLNRLFRHRSKKTSKLRVTGLCAGNSPEAGEFSAQIASNAENVSIWWRHHESHVLGQHSFIKRSATTPKYVHVNVRYVVGFTWAYLDVVATSTYCHI